jgi:hypothetical protein
MALTDPLRSVHLVGGGDGNVLKLLGNHYLCRKLSFTGNDYLQEIVIYLN